MKTILEYLRPCFRRMGLGLTIKFTGTIMDLLLPWILSYLIDEVVPQKDEKKILLYGAAMIFCALTAWLTNITANRMASRVARDTTEKIRRDLFRRIVRLSARQTDEFTVPSLEARLTSDTYNLHQMIGMMQRMGVRAPILLLGGVLVTFQLEPVLAGVFLLVIPFVGGITFAISKKGIPLYEKQQRAADVMVRTVRENASGIRVIKALSKMDYEKERFDGIIRQLRERERRASVTMAASNPLMNFFLNCGLTLVVIVGAWLVWRDLAKPGVILAFLTYFTIMLNAMLSINRMFLMYAKGTASANRIREVLDAPQQLGPEPAREPEPAPSGQPKSAHRPFLCFEEVSFSYYGTANAVSSVSFGLEKGQTLGIIGATGSGKTTLIRLLQRFYDPQAGRVWISGQDVRSMDPGKLHELFGVVFQNDVLLADTVAENIRFGRQIPDREVERAARCAQAEEFIRALPEGYGHRLTIRGSNLSGGQKQRILIARALAGNPQILILDDSSSALDYATDLKLRQAIRRFYPDTTVILIAQRVSSVKNAGLILMLSGGKVIGTGTHRQLMEHCREYREIAVSQMGEGMEEWE
ncbi:MAG: ABC transporter ATP-binding protein [Eubacteriales bacterium]|nr:ABC transporter ATP-binding protein [Eubacteriales bacterium]